MTASRVPRGWPFFFARQYDLHAEKHDLENTRSPPDTRTPVSTLSDLFACPRCDKSPLSAADDAFRCSGCKTDFPTIEGIPWLFAAPDVALAEWRNRLHFALQQLAHEAQRIVAESNART